MSKKRKAKPKEGSPIGIHQELVEQLTMKQAIAKSPEIIQSELICLQALSEDVKTAIHEAGLWDVYLHEQRLKFTLPKGKDLKQSVINFLTAHNRNVARFDVGKHRWI